jgi:hypothetical protein
MTNVSIQTLCCRSGEYPEARAITSSQHHSSRRRTEKVLYTFHSEFATGRTTLVPGLDLGGSLASVLPLAVLARLPTPYPSTIVIYRLASQKVGFRIALLPSRRVDPFAPYSQFLHG